MDIYSPNYYLEAADDAEMIQLAVDAAAERGEKVIIPRRNLRTGEDIWRIPRAVKLYTGSAVIIDSARLRQTDDSFDNIFKNSFARTEAGKKLENRQYDITIEGIGDAILDGGNHNGLVERNQNSDGRPYVIVNSPIHLVNCERIRVKNLKIVNSRYWGMCFHYCSDGRVSDIYFTSQGNCPNQDGVDLRTGCSDFIIENISGYTQDDTVALTCLEGKGTDYLCRVENMDDSIHNVIIRNVTSGTRCAQIRLLNNYGKKLYNVIIENVQSSAEYDPTDSRARELPLRIPKGEHYYPETSCAMPDNVYWSTFEGGERRAGAYVRIGENHYFDPNNPDSRAKLGDTFNIIVRNVQSRNLYPVIISRTLCDSVIENVQAFGDSNVAVFFDGGEFDNITLRDISYSRASRRRDTDKGTENPGQRQYKYCSSVYFNGSSAENLRFDTVVTSETSEAVFAGDGNVSLTARNIVKRREDIPTVLGEGIKVTEY
ncbi:MAG: hypothetical protein GX633_04320 [Clostridiales bacterium]|nr:hypothetical protein [Clostridiales bacterium]